MTHRWSGHPGCWCLDCGAEDPGENAVAQDAYDPFSNTWSDPEAEAAWRERNAVGLAPCAEPNSKRYDPYARAEGSQP